jgi:hypothetical protein
VTDLERLVSAYWESYLLLTSDRRADRKRDDDRWADDEVEAAVRDGAECFPLLIALADSAPSDEGLYFLGAGPIENLLNDGWRDPVVVDRAIGWAERNARFRLALSGVWLSAEVPDDVRQRIVRAVARRDPTPRRRPRRS